MSWQNLVGISIIGLVFSISAAGIFWGERQHQAQQAMAERICHDDQTPEHVAILVDRTDPMTANQQHRMRLIIQEEMASLRVDGRLSIFLIGATFPENPTPAVSVCRPRAGSDVSWWTQNPRQIQSDFEEIFVRPVDGQVKSLAEPAEAPQSPILELIREVSQLPSFQIGVEMRRLVIISDLLQNVPRYSHYLPGTPLGHEEFQRTLYAKAVSTDLEDIDVTLVYLRNKKASDLQTPEHIGFWRSWLEEAGAVVTVRGGPYDG